MKLLIIIPAYNEEDSIVRVVDNLIRNYPQYEYVIINDGSKDLRYVMNIIIISLIFQLIWVLRELFRLD